MKALIEAGADVNKPASPHTVNASGQRTSVIHNVTPVYFAAQEGHTHVVMELIKAGADVNQASSLGFTPLYVAAQQGHEGIVAVLIQAGADARKAIKSGGHAYESRHNKSAGEGRDVVEVLRASLELPSHRSMKRHHRAINHHAPSLSTYPHAASASGPRFADAKTATGSLEILAFQESHHLAFPRVSHKSHDRGRPSSLPRPPWTRKMCKKKRQSPIP